MGCDICGAGIFISISTTDKYIIPFSTIRHFTLCNAKYIVSHHTLNRCLQKNAKRHSDKHTQACVCTVTPAWTCKNKLEMSTKINLFAHKYKLKITVYLKKKSNTTTERQVARVHLCLQYKKEKTKVAMCLK